MICTVLLLFYFSVLFYFTGPHRVSDIRAEFWALSNYMKLLSVKGLQEYLTSVIYDGNLQQRTLEDLLDSV